MPYSPFCALTIIDCLDGSPPLGTSSDDANFWVRWATHMLFVGSTTKTNKKHHHMSTTQHLGIWVWIYNNSTHPTMDGLAPASSNVDLMAGLRGPT